MGFLSCPLPCQISEEKSQDRHNSDYSLSCQPSLPSVPSLTLSPTPSSTSASYRCTATLKGHNSYVFALAVSGEHLFSGSHDNQFRVWRRSPARSLTDESNVVATANGAVKALVVLRDRLFSAHQDHKIRVWKIEQSLKNDAVGGDGRPLRCVATLPTLKDRLLTPFSTKNYIQVRRHKTCTWVHHVDTISALALCHDGSRLYSASWDRTVKIWRTSDFRCLESFNAHDDAINAVVVSSDGLVYTGSADKKIKVWRTDQRGNPKSRHSLVATLEKHKSAVNALALTGDGGVLYSGACDRSIVVWEKEASGGGGMVVVGALRGHENAILCLAVVGESLLCSGSADKTVRMWRREIDRSYACLAVLGGHARPVKCLAVAPNGDGGEGCYWIYSGGLDCDIRVWRISISTFDRQMELQICEG